MKIGIVGGLGYLGSHLCHKLEHDHEVVIYDVNMFNSPYQPVQAQVKNINFLDLTESEAEKNDIVFICCGIDINDFYKAEEYNLYRKVYQDKLIQLNNTMETQYVLFNGKIQNYQDKDYQYAEFVDNTYRLMEQNNLNKCFHYFQVPELYGGHHRVRTDLFINNVISEFFKYKRFILEGDILRNIYFTHVSRYVKHIESMLNCINNQGDYSGDSYDFQSCVMSKFMITNYIAWMLGQEYELYVNPGDDLILDGYGDYSFDETEELNYTLTLYTKLSQQRNIEEFFDINTNNRYIINNALVGNQFTRSILNDQLVSKYLKSDSVVGNNNN